MVVTPVILSYPPFCSVDMCSVVCEIGPVDLKKTHWGQVEVEVNGGKIGISSMRFTYRVSTIHTRTHSLSSDAFTNIEVHTRYFHFTQCRETIVKT